MKKRIFSLLLAFVLLFNLMPLSIVEAFAQDGGNDSAESVSSERKKEEYIEGMVTVSCNGSSTVNLKNGDKIYAFATTDPSLGESVKYNWELMTDSGSWATVNGYIFYYAVISDALLANAKTKDGISQMRCIVEAEGKKYVSNVLTVASSLAQPQSDEAQVLFSAPAPIAEEPEETEEPGETEEPEEPGGSSGESGGSTLDAFHIIINYTYRHENAAPGLHLDGETAANTFTVTLPDHTFYSGTIETPPEIGYLPYVKLEQAKYVTGLTEPYDAHIFEYGEGERREQYVLAHSIDFKEQKDDVTVEVYFIPQEVTFRVKVYEQNLYDDEYTLAETKTYTRYANAAVGEGCTPARKGFAPLYYDDELPVSEDGSFALEVYYDRNYYLVEFDMQDGEDDDAFGATNFFVRYTTSIRLPSPTRPGHSFIEWTLSEVTDENESPVSPHAYPTTAVGGYMIPSVEQNMVYQASWQTETTSYTVIYWLENADDPGFTLDSFKVVSGVEPGASVDAKDDLSISDKSCFTFCESLSDKNVRVASDGTTAVNAYYLRNYYTINFSGYDDNCLTPEHTHTEECPKGNCTLENHTHTEECGIAEQICDKIEHIHEDSCCQIEEHSHTDASAGGCCTIPYHVHGTGSSSDCTKPEHAVHHDACYSRSALKEADSLTNKNQKDAYSGLKSRVTGPLNGYVYRYRLKRNSTIYNFIFIHEHWFYLGEGTDYNGVTVSIGNPGTSANSYNSAKASTICGYEIHTHGDGTCNCPITEHDHTTGCTCEIPRHVHGEGACEYTVCGEEQHIHSIGCYTYNCGKAAHTHTADCVRSCQQIEHTSSNCAGARYFLSFKCKYNADISKIWPSSDIFTAGERWKANTYFSQVLVYLPFMPPANITFSMDKGSASEIYNISYYLESISTTGTYIENYDMYFDHNNTVNAKYNYLTRDEDFFDIPGFTQYASTPAFDNSNQIETGKGGEVALYYSRNEYQLEFVSLGTTLSPYTKTLKYQQPIGASFELLEKDIPYPSNKESGAIRFDGWYTTPNCANGTEFIFDGNTIMPLGGLVLYAKWVDCSYTVNIYSNVEKELLLSTQTVVFDSLIVEPAHTSKAPTLSDDTEQLIFAGWYYKDGSEEKRFDFNTMSVKCDMEIYAKWTSRIPINYRIRYVYWDGQQYVDIAEASTGASLAGITKNFVAKVGNELDEDFQVNYFPEVRAHSMTMSSEEAENEYLFVYSSPSEISYTITHKFTDNTKQTRASGTGVFEELFGNGNKTLTMSMTVTVTGEDIKKRTAYTEISFREGLFDVGIVKAAEEEYGVSLSPEQEKKLISAITSMSPDGFIKKLILTTDNEKNVAEFNWENRGADQARYQIIYYTESVDGSEYVINSSETGLVTAGTTIDVTLNESLIKKIEHFELDATHPDSILRGMASTMEFDSETGGLKKGLVLRLYYTRKEYKYTVYHYKKGSTHKLAEPTTSRAKYEHEIAIDSVAVQIPGYALTNGAEVAKVGGNDEQSIICYYQGLEVYYQYHVLGTGATIANPTETVVIGGKDPSAKELSLWNDGVFLNAWYYSIDNGERKKVPEGWLSNNDMVVSPKITGVDLAGKTVYIYAEVLPFTRRFSVEGYASPENDPQAFVFRLVGKQGTPTSGIDITFIVFDNGYTDIKHLPYGEYTLTTLHWAWRLGHPLNVTFNGEELDAESGTVTLHLDVSGDVVINYSADENEQWLSDDASGVVPMETQESES